MPNNFHVAQTGSDTSVGSSEQPFRTINRAAELAQPGDSVIVHAGTYREWVKPVRGGISNQRRITYQAAPGEKVVIKGSEQVTGWTHLVGSVWMVDLPGSFFADFNPFATEIEGDWIVHPGRDAPRKHLGEVYLNGLSFYEATSREEVYDPAQSIQTVDDWTQTKGSARNGAQTKLVWYAEVDSERTRLWANFGEADPNVELVEVNVRRSVFYPVEHHLNYITVRGFELAHAATPWAPPTADQPGLIGPNWAKGWIIEDNIIHDAKCSAISLGKESSTGHNLATIRGDKPGYQYQLESVFAARRIGWDREHIGSHIVRRNTIFDCGQNAIVGHLGAVFSTIEDNRIHRIAIKREFHGYEIAGIKLHAAIDVQIVHNRIHDCTLGIWLDWQAQGTRVSRNLLHDNDRDLFIEVSHGPYLVDHNVLASGSSLELFSQGGAFVHNLFFGAVTREQVLDRPTPYHLPHSTQVAGYAAVVGGDDRYIGNIFMGAEMDRVPVSGRSLGYGTAGYDGHPTSMDEYLELVGDPSQGDHSRFAGVLQPVYVRNNLYLGGARAFASEVDPVFVNDEAVSVELSFDRDEVHLNASLPLGLKPSLPGVTTSADLPRVRIADADFENPDGSPVSLDVDLVGRRKEPSGLFPFGPVAVLNPGLNRVRLW